MNIRLVTPKKKINVKNVYIVTVDTMTGDADDYHSFKIEASSIDELREIIIGLCILVKAYPNGRGGYDEYCGTFYDKYIADKLFSYEGIHDTIEETDKFDVSYYDENAKHFNVEYEMDPEMIERINNFDGLTEDEIIAMEFEK